MTTTEIRPEDLPAWMRPREHTLDWGLLILVAFCVLILWPFAVVPGLPHYSNAELYAVRSTEVSRLVRSGVWYSRWAPDLNYALGSPLFNYLAPLPHHLMGYHQAITEIDPLISLKIMLCLSILAAGTGMFLFARQRWGARGGVLAGIAYLFSAPISLTLPYLQADLAPLLALGLLPWVLWAFDRLWKASLRRAIWLATGLLCAFILSDARIAVLGIMILLIALVSARKSNYRYAVIAVLAAAGLTAFFWLPALLERANIEWLAVSAPAYSGPIPLDEIIAPIPQFGVQMLNVPVYRGIGMATIILAMIGAASLLVQAMRKTVAVDSVAFLATGLILLALASPIFYRVWPSALAFQPLLPYHALLLAVFCFAVVSAQASCWLDVIPERWRIVGLIILCLVPLIFWLPITNLPNWQAVAQPINYLTGLQEELNGYQLGSLREGILLPSTIRNLPDPRSGLIEDLEGDTFTRLGRQLSSASQINILERGLLHENYRFDNNQPITFTFYALAFTGWTATLDDQPLDTHSTQAGLLAVNTPSATHELIIRMESTLLQTLAGAISVISAVILLIVVWRIPLTLATSPRSLLSGREALGLVLALMIYGNSLLLYVSLRPSLLALRPRLDEISGQVAIQSVVFDNLGLVSYAIPTSDVGPGDSVSFSAFWKVQKATTDNYQTTLQIVSPTTKQVVLSNVHHHPGGMPTSHWTPNRYVRDDFSLTLPPDLPVGSYTLNLSIANCNNNLLTPCDDLAVESQVITIPAAIRVR
jgi:hypothetical protein